MRLGRRIEMVEHSLEEAVTKAREQGRETSRSLSDRIAEAEETSVATLPSTLNACRRNGSCEAQSNMSSLCSAPESRERRAWLSR